MSVTVRDKLLGRCPHLSPPVKCPRSVAPSLTWVG